MTEYLPVSRLREHPANVREDLGDLAEMAASIRSHGILQPVIVQPHPSETGAYLILTGHRRVAAAKLAGLTEVPVRVRAAAGSQAIEIMLIENCQRADLTAVEKAEALAKLRRRGMTGRQISQATGINEGDVSRYLSLLDLDPPSLEQVRSGVVGVVDAISAVREFRKRERARTSGKTPRPAASAQPEHFSHRHPLADAARLRCQLSGHIAPKYGKDQAGGSSKVACGACWEYVIRADERGEQLPADKPSRGPKEERLQVIASLPMLTGAVPDGEHVTAGQAADAAGVSKRTVERYKRELASAGEPR